MVFDYMDHDLTGLMEREGHRFTVPQVGQGQLSRLPFCVVPFICLSASSAFSSRAQQISANSTLHASQQPFKRS